MSEMEVDNDFKDPKESCSQTDTISDRKRFEVKKVNF